MTTPGETQEWMQPKTPALHFKKLWKKSPRRQTPVLSPLVGKMLPVGMVTDVLFSALVTQGSPTATPTRSASSASTTATAPETDLVWTNSVSVRRAKGRKDSFR